MIIRDIWHFSIESNCYRMLAIFEICSTACIIISRYLITLTSIYTYHAIQFVADIKHCQTVLILDFIKTLICNLIRHIILSIKNIIRMWRFTFIINWQLHNKENYWLQFATKIFLHIHENEFIKAEWIGYYAILLAFHRCTCCTDCTNRRSESSYSHKCFENKIDFYKISCNRVTRPIFFASYVQSLILKMAWTIFRRTFEDTSHEFVFENLGRVKFGLTLLSK